MEIFTKQLTPVDFGSGLMLPPRSNLKPLQNLQGTIELSTIVESAAGTRLPEPVTIQCSTTRGSLVFKRGWYDIAREVGLKSGDTVTFYQEVNGGAQFKLKSGLVHAPPMGQMHGWLDRRLLLSSFLSTPAVSPTTVMAGRSARCDGVCWWRPVLLRPSEEMKTTQLKNTTGAAAMFSQEMSWLPLLEVDVGVALGKIWPGDLAAGT
ncbi:hypothetical protein POTOM_013043 [Populus tomentosa]|uniref:TF-B3 domain-containing protein n=1 Tax=Populus tomentosa TaxID=118781 RepID=A0A8X8D6K0_POPTO|nr:hypothetical protein POTOM_013043 [Populus tomentosa]